MPADGIAIIGAGMAGLACARRLYAAQQPVTVLERSAHAGGRMATRRLGRLAFDYGAQFLVATDEDLRDYVALAHATGHVASWKPRLLRDPSSGAAPGTPSDWLVGTPGMHSFLLPLAAGLSVRCGVHVVSCVRRLGQWWCATESGAELGPYSAVVLALPVADALPLIADAGGEVEMATRTAHVRMTSCWSAMVGFAQRVELGADVFAPSDGAVAWAARDVSKPRRRSPHDCWVLHASADWSGDRPDAAASVVARELLDEFARIAAPGEAAAALFKGAYRVAHFWRQARVEVPLGDACIWDGERMLGLCGDWCLEAGIEAAWRSGRALAEPLLAAVR